MISMLVRKKYRLHNKLKLRRTFDIKLARSLNLVIRSRKYNYPHYDDLCINWGSSYYNGTHPKRWLNDPASVHNAINKIKTLKILHNNNIPSLTFTLNKEDAKYLFNTNDKVYCRTKVKSCKGKGIVIANNKDELVDAELYTAHFPLTHEYRYHIFNGKVIHVQEKRKRKSETLEQLGLVHNPLIRNFDNGYVFCIQDVIIFPEIEESCIKTVEALGLDFAAIDVGAIIKSVDGDVKLQDYAIIEVNTAPALKDTTFNKYHNALKSYIEAL